MKEKIKLKELQLLRLRFRRFTLRTGVLLLAVLAAVVIAFNFWFVNHSESVLEQIVHDQSNGKLRLNVRKFDFNWIKNKIVLHDALIYSTDTTAAINYAVNAKYIGIKARGFLPLLFNREILIDSMILSSPHVSFTRNIKRIKNRGNNKTTNHESFSVAREMGNLSKSILQVINVLKIDKLKLNDGRFSLIDNTQPKEKPFIVSNIYMQLEHLQLDSTQAGKKGKQKISFANNIAIRTFNQDLSLPGGRHSVAFKDFRVNLANKRVEFDSCTIRATKGDSSRSSFKIFFDKLQLTKINFDSLYSSATIVADSVFCSKPKIFLDVDGDIKVPNDTIFAKKKAGVERVDALIQQMIGDMSLNYVGVKDADIDVSTIKKGKSSTFSSRRSNFEIYDLKIQQDEERPIHLNKLFMSLHNYENILHNGRYKIAFDSVSFENGVINLTKFSFKEYSKEHIGKSLSMPSFQVSGLSWEALLYDNVFSAKSASFFNPNVDYTTNNATKNRGAKNIFEVLNNIDNIMNLQNLKVIDGNILLRLGTKATVHLSKTNLDLRANDLTKATQIKSVQRSVNALSFDKGIFLKDDWAIQIDSVHLSKNKSGMKAAQLSIRSNNIVATGTKIEIGNIILDSAKQSIIVDGIAWKQGAVSIDQTKTQKQRIDQNNSKEKIHIVFVNLNGNDTKVDLRLKQSQLSGFFNTISLAKIQNKANSIPEIIGLNLDGQDVCFTGNESKAFVERLHIADRSNSILHNINFEKTTTTDSVIIKIPKLTIIPNIAEMLKGTIALDRLAITNPVLMARLKNKSTTEIISSNRGTTFFSTPLAIIERPKIQLTLINKNDSVSHINWDGERQDGYIKFFNFASSADRIATADQIEMNLSDLEFIGIHGKRIATNHNKLHLELKDLSIRNNNQGKPDWHTSLNILSLNKLRFDSLGKNLSILEVDKGTIQNINLTATSFKNPIDILANSTHLQINAANGKYTTDKKSLNWYGFVFKNEMMRLDSLHLVPQQSVKDYRIAKAFNEDYLKIQTGKISVGPINIATEHGDSIVKFGNIAIKDVDLFTFKDKTQPDSVRKYKPLPVEMLRNLKDRINIDRIQIQNMRATYWEINPDTDSLGIVPVENLNVQFSNVKNYNLKPKDSLYIQASANVLGSLYTTLSVAQSYIDTSGYMRMNLNTGSMDLQQFNSVLIPLVGAKVMGGKLKGLSINTVGNNDAAFGSAYMRYHKLQIGLLNKKDFSEDHFFTRLVSKLAMVFIIRKNNQGKKADVFFERVKTKSPINYIIKTSLEGIKSSIGLPGTKAKQLKYNKRIVP